MWKSILNYFTANGKNAKTSQTRQVVEASSSESVVWNAGLSSREHALVVEEIVNATGSTKFEHVSYKESDKLMIAKYRNIHGPA